MTSLVDFQKSIFEQIDAFKSRGDERLVVRFSAGGLHWAMDAETVENVNQLPKVVPTIPAAPGYIRGLVQQEGNVLTVFDLGYLLTQRATPVNRTNRVLMLNTRLAMGTALLVDKTFGLVPLSTLVPATNQTALNAVAEKWVDSRWVHEDSEQTIWHWLQPDSLLNDAAFAVRRAQ